MHFICVLGGLLSSAAWDMMKDFTTIPLNKGNRKHHICRICNKTFQSASNLSRHYRIHSGEKPFKCCVCQKGFNQTNSLKAHLRSIHQEVDVFHCQTCNLYFDEKKGLETHQDEDHKLGTDLLVCKMCGVPFTSRATLVNHIKITHGAE